MMRKCEKSQISVYLTAVALFSPSTSQAIPTYDILELNFDAVGLNDRGQVVGNTSQGAVLWDAHSGVVDIGSGVATDINNLGAVVGYGGGASTFAGWLYDSDVGRREIDGLSRPTVINDLGQVGGWPTPEQLNGGYLWDPESGFETILNPGGGPGGSSADVFLSDLNNDGLAVGFASSVIARPVFWQRGDEQPSFFPAIPLPLTGPRPGFIGGATAVNDHGQIAMSAGLWPLGFEGGGLGEGCDTRWCFRAVLWTDMQPEIIAVGGARGINNLGQVVGGGVIGQGNAFIWDPLEGLFDLNNLLHYTSSFDGFLYSAFDINEHGQMLAINQARDRSFLLTPHDVPEPGTLLLFAFGVFLISIKRLHTTEVGTRIGDP